MPYNPKDTSKTLTIAIPVSYERQYITFGEPRKKSSFSKLEADTKCLVASNMSRRACHGEGRYLLKDVGKALNIISSHLKKKGGYLDQAGKMSVVYLKQAGRYIFDNIKDSLEIDEGR